MIMTCDIPLDECRGLISLMMTGDDRSPTFDWDGAQCTVTTLDGGHAYFEAITCEFTFGVVHPQWYDGGYGQPARVFFEGDPIELARWLPMDTREDKCRLIEALPISNADRTLALIACT